MQGFIVQQGFRSIFAHLAEESGIVAWSVNIGLYTNSFTPTKNTKLSQLTLASFTGYTPVVWAGGSQAGYDQTSQAILSFEDNEWTLTDDLVSPVTVYGICIYTDADELIAVGNLSTPAVFEVNGDSLHADIVMHSGGTISANEIFTSAEVP